MKKIHVGKLGGDEGRTTGPEPGEGASTVGGIGDVEGTPSDALPPRPVEDRPSDEPGDAAVGHVPPPIQ